MKVKSSAPGKILGASTQVAQSPPLRVLSLLPGATDTVRALGAANLLVGRTHECDWPELQALPIVTSDKLGEMPPAELDAAMAACGGALPTLGWCGGGIALLDQGLSPYRTDVEKLVALRPDVILTQMQGLGLDLTPDHYWSPLEQLLGYRPTVVQLAATEMEGVWRDMRSISEALKLDREGRDKICGGGKALGTYGFGRVLCCSRPLQRTIMAPSPPPHTHAASLSLSCENTSRIPCRHILLCLSIYLEVCLSRCLSAWPIYPPRTHDLFGPQLCSPQSTPLSSPALPSTDTWICAFGAQRCSADCRLRRTQRAGGHVPEWWWCNGPTPCSLRGAGCRSSWSWRARGTCWDEWRLQPPSPPSSSQVGSRH
ncbi:hypothetical protein Vretimale_13375 [Volvox reticuliferus]|uniref:Fe/B12 periplasmic-binding domain-containing protein n=1 Tax=Volvox reticuliferus TaxID=1737510 RepID=A0A8J4FQ40_9CHLO|nr:hypothetical protein Vretifemale_14050 [Volvox reticuliferus]GIM09504.1 hypothetical protein Vretimale_13375 [Volvox reticuliferus]